MKIIIFLLFVLLLVIIYINTNDSPKPINFWYSTTQLNNAMSPETGSEYFYKYYVNGNEFTEQTTDYSKFDDAILVMQILPGDSVIITKEQIKKYQQKNF